MKLIFVSMKKEFNDKPFEDCAFPTGWLGS